MKKTLIWGVIFAGLAVALGAFGAHALKPILGSYQATWETAVHYQMYHALALLFIGLLGDRKDQRFLATASLLFSLGIVLFSGSLYVLAISHIKLLGAITPLGGVCFIAAWILTLLNVIKQKKSLF
ncbi:Protein of uncharacterised function (DUF423) [Listeria grayi]|uniref:DUF423 domain-containing protein n=1 Tax=Listeria grayi TaxID=1641 RepID=UPI000F715E87|nr:DUF423 domain-containing protein [Listeria grayi]VEI35526.1 Protein of uncharacterised function (DUF423) [Listeria grayi]